MIDYSFLDGDLMWGDGIDNKFRIFHEDGEYSLSYTNIYGCVFSDTFELQVISTFKPLVDTTICFEDVLIINNKVINEPGSYLDTFYNDQNCPIITEYLVSIDHASDILDTFFVTIKEGEEVEWFGEMYSQEGIFEYTGFNENGCLFTSYLKVKIELEAELYIPNIISANNDGVNDAFYIQSNKDKDIIINDFTIYDRFGSIVHRQSGNLSTDDILWYDGAETVRQGVFVYCLSAKIDGENKVFKGSITVIR